MTKEFVTYSGLKPNDKFIYYELYSTFKTKNKTNYEKTTKQTVILKTLPFNQNNRTDIETIDRKFIIKCVVH